MTMKTIPTKVVRHHEPASAAHYYKQTPDFLKEFETFTPVNMQWTEHVVAVEVMHDSIELGKFSDTFTKRWCSFVEKITFDFSSALKMNITIIDDELNSTNHRLIKSFCEVISEYVEEVSSTNKLSISVDAARNYLYLLPVLGHRLHRVSIDADTGFINVGFKSRHKETLTVLVTNGGEVHYSLIGRRSQLVKISGTAKIKDKHDYFAFEKILRML